MAEEEARLSSGAEASGRGALRRPVHLELLAPAGDPSSLQAALQAGADAVYLGLMTLNARRRARNFTREELQAAVEAAHDHGARAYLTLNTDLAERELDLAARVLEFACRAGCDAVLVRDPALWALRPAFPQLEFHLSTQACVTSSVDVAAAAELGAARAVLARELTLAEIAAASSVAGVKTEVFIQGALCFSVSGRCLMSSWVGGRSGNRGVCASPCRVPWETDGTAPGTPLSMRDLVAIERLADLAQAGVAAAKIEGRMKTPQWVGQAVGLYRRALDGDDFAHLRAEIQQLGEYTGRQMTCGYLDGQRDGLTGLAGRLPLSPGQPAGAGEEAAERDACAAGFSFDLEISVESRGIQVRCQCPGGAEVWSIPKTVVRRQHKAVSIEQLFEWLAARPLHGFGLGRATTNDPPFLLVPHAVNALVSRIGRFLQRSQKRRESLAEIELPEAVREVLRKSARCSANRSSLASPPDRVRLGVEDVEEFLARVRPGAVTVEGMTTQNLKAVRSLCRRVPLIVALPAVFFEEDIGGLTSLVEEAARADLVVEVNSWGGWWLAKQARARTESGPGLPILNSLAARVLAKHGVECVTLSPEADRRQLEDVAAACPLPCSLVVFGRPPLIISRVALPEEYEGRTFTDRRGTRVVARRERGLWVFRPVEPFDLRNVENERLRVRHLVVDLVGSPDPLRDWGRVPPRGRPVFRFNYERGLA